MTIYWRYVTRILGVILLSFSLIACAAGDNALTIVTKTGEYRFAIELVDTDATRAQGLMYRTELGPNAGMLFDFFEERPVSFWMRNTLIPLDMIFVSADGTVVNVHANAKPLDPTPIPSAAPVRFVFEIAGGRAAEIGLKAGDKLVHPRVQSGN
ncbi:DUF192 domain-containing protein [Maritalea sp.]|jgi:uncharacterized membrane protein (UPF0127 family)|uniref:DUF192 domain-containing protein n=1 Tax=Maritalea sp. TaxID=2003361 RepID=UPI0039E2854E